ncbi:MAG: (2Fe-2S)-binding protein [Saprospiraceae bacterium]|nr:(2Fe-2S)-binding protein [Saprospiraceae bacterium]
MKIEFTINGRNYKLDVNGDEPLLWLIRDTLKLKGTKFGCGKAACGACTVIIDGQATRSCSYAARIVNGKSITTIEGLENESGLHPVQQAWINQIVPQCGYCQSGFIMASVALLERFPNPTEQQINDSLTNFCRCGTYPRIRKALNEAIENMTSKPKSAV